MNEWWIDLYDDLVADLLLDGSDPQHATRAVDFLARTLDLRADHRVFDQGCGTGRLSVALLARGLKVWGLDSAANYIDRARRACAAWGDAAAFEVGDMHVAGPPVPCDAVVSWWTCLGYNRLDSDNVLPLSRAWAGLKPGGSYVIDTMNVAQVLRQFRAHDEQTLARQDGTATLRRTSRIDLGAGVLHKAWAWTLPDGRVLLHPSAVRMYLPHEWARLLAEVGFADLRFFGDVNGEALTQDSPRCIIVARRPA